MAIEGKKIAIVGCGPGARECITLEALLVIESAEVLVGAARLLELFASESVERVAVRGYREETIAAIAAHAGKRIAVLVTGDPGLASLAATVVDHFGLENCHLLPGISSVQVAFARLGMDWEGARIVSAHKAVPDYDYSSFVNENKIAVLSGNVESTRWLAGLVRSLGNDWRVIVCQDLTLETESVRELGADEIEALPQPLRAVVLIVRKRKP